MKLIKKVRSSIFSTRLPYTNEKVTEINCSMVHATYISTQDMIYKLQQLKGKTKLKLYEKISDYYDELKYRRQSGVFNLKKILS